jgi:hypothetical protein
MNKTVFIIMFLLMACGAANRQSPECAAQINLCMEQCALDPEPSERQDSIDRVGGDSRTRCEQLCDKCTQPKATIPVPDPNDPMYSNGATQPAAPTTAPSITTEEPAPPTP